VYLIETDQLYDPTAVDLHSIWNTKYIMQVICQIVPYD